MAIGAFLRSALTRCSLRLCLIALLAGLTACAASWRRDIEPGWSETIETGTRFQHRALFKPGSGDTLHIYIEGDGDIWRTPQELFPDPTPAQALTLQLMRQDPAPALFIGRPCYWQVADAACAPRWWTAARYAEEVVASLAAVAARRSNGYDGIVLIGHSGGGALAALMAPRLPAARALITVAGNLDTEA